MIYTKLGLTESVVGSDILKTIGPIVIKHPENTFSLTPASLTGLHGIENCRDLLHGTGIDWGCGAGCLSIALARLKEVDKVIGLDIVKENIDISGENAKNNEVSNKTKFIHSDSYVPYEKAEHEFLDNLKGTLDFIVANPPSSSGDDGFSFRHIVIQDGCGFLKKGGVVLLNISSQYGKKRINNLITKNPEYRYNGIIASLNRSAFDLKRNDLLECLYAYVEEEKRSGVLYEFINPDNVDDLINATDAMKLYNEKKINPFTYWQSHMFTKI